MNLLEKVRERWRQRPPQLDWVQLEVSTRCNASCAYCPRSAGGAAWRERDLPHDLLDELIPGLARTRYVHLQGWGEPLLHPRFFDMVNRLRAAGRQVGTTSNGLLLDRTAARALVAAGVEVVALSVAGSDAAANDVVRRGAPLERVVAAARALRDARAGSDRPRIHLAYMLLRSGLDSIQRLPELVAKTGADEVVVSTLSLITHSELVPEAILADDGETLREVRNRLAAVEGEVERGGARVSFELLSPLAPPGACAESPTRSVFVAADGGVHPCVLTGLPLDDPLPSFTWDGGTPRERFSYGTLHSAGLGSAWRASPGRDFRERLASTGTAPPSCETCLKRHRSPLHPRVDLVPVL